MYCMSCPYKICALAFLIVCGCSRSDPQQSGDSNTAKTKAEPGTESKYGQHDMPLRTFIAVGPREPKTFTVACQFGNHFNYEFLGARETHYSIEMQDLSRVHISGFIEKESELGKRMLNLLKDGKWHWLTVEVEHAGQSPSCVVIRDAKPIKKR